MCKSLFFFISQMSDAEMETLLLDELVGPTAHVHHRYVESREAASVTARDYELERPSIKSLKSLRFTWITNRSLSLHADSPLMETLHCWPRGQCLFFGRLGSLGSRCNTIVPVAICKYLYDISHHAALQGLLQCVPFSTSDISGKTPCFFHASDVLAKRKE